MQNIPPPIQPRPKAPERPPERKPSLFNSKGYIERKFFEREFRQDKYYEKWRISQKEREEIGRTIGQLFGELIGKSEETKILSLAERLQKGEYYLPPDEKIKKAADEIIKKYGREKAQVIGKTLKELLGK